MELAFKDKPHAVTPRMIQKIHMALKEEKGVIEESWFWTEVGQFSLSLYTQFSELRIQAKTEERWVGKVMLNEQT